MIPPSRKNHGPPPELGRRVIQKPSTLARRRSIPKVEDQPMNVIIASRDGAMAVRITMYEGTYSMERRVAVGSYFSFVRPDDAGRGRVAVVFSDLFQFQQPKDFGLSEQLDRDAFQIECAFARIGDELDTTGQLSLTPPGTSAAQLDCFESQFQAWRERKAPKDDGILRYIRAKLYWGW